MRKIIPHPIDDATAETLIGRAFGRHSLTGTQTAVLVYVTVVAGLHGGDSWPITRAQACAALGIDARTWRKAVAALERGGHIEVTRRPGWPHLIHLVDTWESQQAGGA